MSSGLEIRWHGRGGQGAKTAALLLADVAFKTGAYVQGFPEYGPERMGAPITAYNRISRNEIRVHSNIYTPDLVVVVDESLLESVDVTAGLKKEGAIIVNTPKSAEEIREEQIKDIITPMRWDLSIAKMEELGVTEFYDTSADGAIKKFSRLKKRSSKIYTYADL